MPQKINSIKTTVYSGRWPALESTNMNSIIKNLSSLNDFHWKWKDENNQTRLEKTISSFQLENFPEELKFLLGLHREIEVWSDSYGMIFYDIDRIERWDNDPEDALWEKNILYLGEDGGAYWYLLDTKNFLGFGAYAIYKLEMGNPFIEEAILVGKTLVEFFQNLNDHGDFYEFSSVEELRETAANRVDG